MPVYCPSPKVLICNEKRSKPRGAGLRACPKAGFFQPVGRALSAKNSRSPGGNRPRQNAAHGGRGMQSLGTGKKCRRHARSGGMKFAGESAMMEDCRKNLRFLSQIAFASAFFILALFGGGCATNDVTNPPRSATEQLLISTAADRAMTNADLSVFANKKVFLDASYFDSYDPKYAFGDIRDALSSAGALLVDNITNCDIVVEARAGALSIDYSTSLFGIPNMGIPVPLSGTLSIPQLAFYESQKQDAVAKIALLAYEYKSRRHYYSSGSMLGKTYNYYHKIFMVSWRHTDIPEEQKTEKKRDEDNVHFRSTPQTAVGATGADSTMAAVPAPPANTSASSPPVGQPF